MRRLRSCSIMRSGFLEKMPKKSMERKGPLRTQATMMTMDLI